MKSGNLKSNLKVLWCQGEDLARWRLMPQSWRIFILQVVAANTRASRWTVNNGGKETNEKDNHRWRSTAMHSKAISGWIGLDWILLVLLEHLAVLTNKVLVKELERKEEGDWLESIQSSKHFHTRAPYLCEKVVLFCAKLHSIRIAKMQRSRPSMVNKWKIRVRCAVRVRIHSYLDTCEIPYTCKIPLLMVQSFVTFLPCIYALWDCTRPGSLPRKRQHYIGGEDAIALPLDTHLQQCSSHPV